MRHARVLAYLCMRMLHAYIRAVCVCARVCGRDAFTHVCGKKRPGARERGGRGREDVDIFLRATRECRERHAFDWPRGMAGGGGGGRPWDERMRGEGDSGGGREEEEKGGARRRWQRGWRGWSTLCRRFFGAFFYGRRPSLAWMNEHGEEHQ